MSASLTSFLYLIAAVLFILALRGLSHPETSRRGNQFGMIGMAVAVLVTLSHHGMFSGAGVPLILLAMAIGGGVGAFVAWKIQMTALPQLVAAFHSLVGLAAVFVAAAALNAPEAFNIGTPGHLHTQSLVEMSLGLAIGAITFSGSVIAFAKLQGIMSGAPITFPNQHRFNAILGGVIFLLVVLFVATGGNQTVFWILALLSVAIGFLLIIPIGGADMPVVVSMLNSYSGWAACGIGFTVQNLALIVTGALVGASGAILSYIMCKGMNRSIINVLLGGFGSEGGAAAAGGAKEQRSVKSGAADDAAFIMKNAAKVIVVPGYGMAVAQAQHAVREMADLLKKEGVDVKYAIHPVAGRMPGHMNVLLAEANVPYDEVFELEDINNEFSTADVAYVIGANDVTNPAAKTDRSSAIYGMPILDVEKAGTVLFIKRSMASGYAGVDNELFFRDNTMMLFGDAKKMTEEIVKSLGH
ncbi:pyridine nucleotide transhydrogenase subunit beta [Rhodovastum atsumiense]|uniref:NAD(P) transhydrogenase subunit beta n=1 Tax=Rhodovastum atsumiense TaxID=504468 RepID=A0A5M6ILJ5_9PROT|nr:NAD(P)(+) transhydrogenase (Re/Si-specific) subunit beta [Rhodovastum atsumiense]KAA5609042.1 NAD(P)(+) transhydrogenase (Re/Si-specific) subunit beta [Rhodovastum atsumiense]CAH2604683.1 pyridine nucleotide transhydrogenase subunit beta [Rhodovastum atsumiense]